MSSDIPGNLVVRTYAPARRWIMVGAAVLLAGVALYLAFEFGRSSAGYDAMQAAAQAGGRERRITIRCAVEDSGPGIEKESFDRLFESFFTTKKDGMGIGLSVCRSIVEACGGRIAAD